METKKCKRDHDVPANSQQRCKECVRDCARLFKKNKGVLTTQQRRELRPVLTFQAMLLRAWGLDLHEVGAALGCRRTMAGELLSDPHLVKRRVRMEAYGGECKECGGPTSAPRRKSDGPHMLCMYCVQGVGRPKPDVSRLVSRSLLDVDLLERAERAVELCGRAKTVEERLDLLAAVVWPSDAVHKVAA